MFAEQVYELSHSSIQRGASILFHGQWSRLVNGCTTCNQTVTDSACMHKYTETNPIVFISHIIAPRHMIDSEIASNRCDHICPRNRSLDGDTLQVQNGGHPSDIAQCIVALCL